MTLSYPYQTSSHCVMILNDKTKQTYQELKKTKDFNFDFLSTSENEILSKKLCDSITQFSMKYIHRYPGPTLLFSLAQISECLKLFQAIENKKNARFLMAIKSFKVKDSPVFTMAKEHISGFDVSNENEYNFLPDHLENKFISVTSPVLPVNFDVFLKKNNNVCFTLDSIEQHKEFLKVKQNYEFCVRLNTSLLLKDNNSQEKFNLSHFGFDPHNHKILKEIIHNTNHKFRGFHMQNGFNMHPKKIGASFPEGNLPDIYPQMAKAALELAHDLDINLQYLNLGGSLAYLSYQELQALVTKIKSIVPDQTQVFFEPGRFITLNAGFALTKIECVMPRENYLDVIVDLSSQSHLRWANPKLIIPLTENDETLTVRIFGPTCTELDHLGNFTVPKNIRTIFQKENILLFSNISGYSASWNIDFNGIPSARINYF